MRKKAVYTNEFKIECARIAIDSDESIAQTASNLGVKVNTLYNWVLLMKDGKLDSSVKAARTLSPQEMQKEIISLRKKLKKAEMEREILKKATAFFSSLEQ